MLAIVSDGHDIGGNDANAEGEAGTAPRSQVMMPEPLTDTVATACDS